MGATSTDQAGLVSGYFTQTFIVWGRERRRVHLIDREENCNCMIYLLEENGTEIILAAGCFS